MLTTTDNPFDPLTQWDDWKAFDENMGYFTCGLLDRFAITSDELSEADYDLAVLKAIDEICFLNPYGKHKKITYEDSESSTITDDAEQNK